jgi:hypothetical protein
LPWRIPIEVSASAALTKASMNPAVTLKQAHTETSGDLDRIDALGSGA